MRKPGVGGGADGGTRQPRRYAEWFGLRQPVPPDIQGIRYQGNTTMCMSGRGVLAVVLVALLGVQTADAAMILPLSESANGSIQWKFVPSISGSETYHGSSDPGFVLKHVDQQGGLGVDLRSSLQFSSVDPASWTLHASFDRTGTNTPDRALYGRAMTGFQWIFEVAGDGSTINWTSITNGGTSLVTLYDITGTPVQLTPVPGGIPLLDGHLYSLSAMTVADGWQTGLPASATVYFTSTAEINVTPEPATAVLLMSTLALALRARRRLL